MGEIFKRRKLLLAVLGLIILAGLVMAFFYFYNHDLYKLPSRGIFVIIARQPLFTVLY